MIEATGAKVIAITPEKSNYLNKMAEKTDARFTLLTMKGILSPMLMMLLLNLPPRSCLPIKLY